MPSPPTAPRAMRFAAAMRPHVAVETIIIAYNGCRNVYLVYYHPGENVVTKFQVNMRALYIKSPIFRRMLYPYRYTRACDTPTVSELEIVGESIEAVQLLMNVLHGHQQGTYGDYPLPTPALMAQFALGCITYDCIDACRIRVADWLRRWQESDYNHNVVNLATVDQVSIANLLAVAEIFRVEDKRVYFSAWAGLLMPYELLPVWEHVPVLSRISEVTKDEIRRHSAELFEYLGNAVRAVHDQLQDDEIVYDEPEPVGICSSVSRKLELIRWLHMCRGIPWGPCLTARPVLSVAQQMRLATSFYWHECSGSRHCPFHAAMARLDDALYGLLSGYFPDLES